MSSIVEQGPRNSRVFLRFIDDFGVAGHTDVCRDYVEVRYNSSLALTGARFCGDNLPREVLVSATNEMLVLFRTFKETRVCDDVKYPWKCIMAFSGFKVSSTLIDVFVYRRDSEVSDFGRYSVFFITDQ